MKKIVMAVSLISSLSFANVCGEDKSVDFILPLKDRNVQDRITKEIVPTPVDNIAVACVDKYDDLYFIHDGKSYNIGGTYTDYVNFISGGSR